MKTFDGPRKTIQSQSNHTFSTASRRNRRVPPIHVKSYKATIQVATILPLQLQALINTRTSISRAKTENMAFSKPPFPLLFVFISLSAAITHATVPPSKTFTYINQGPFGGYNIEYGANYRVLDTFTYPFRRCFYNTTPNAYTLTQRMQTRPSESVMRRVWDANLAKPVRENATLSFRRDGNLGLSDADGKVA
ncbi:hypothetical protein MRB53_035853 [Persea americana]|uniref:Uncharacterized protein n=1 Tax=Persea americana TaxID=3435 RepID=A0ACC2K5T2_PERAE|nr:hypothetical protein MRB53_035853 [Persea americana]